MSIELNIFYGHGHAVAHLQYGGFAVAMLVFGFLFANAIPFFNDMLGYEELSLPLCDILLWSRFYCF